MQCMIYLSVDFTSHFLNIVINLKNPVWMLVFIKQRNTYIPREKQESLEHLLPFAPLHLLPCKLAFAALHKS